MHHAWFCWGDTIRALCIWHVSCVGQLVKFRGGKRGIEEETFCTRDLDLMVFVLTILAGFGQQRSESSSYLAWSIAQWISQFSSHLLNFHVFRILGILVLHYVLCAGCGDDGSHLRFNRNIAERLARNRWVEKWEIGGLHKTMIFQHSRNRLYRNAYILNRLWKTRVYINTYWFLGIL